MDPAPDDPAKDWPRNEHGFYACPCCGYHTLIETAGGFEICGVCNWEEDTNFAKPWDTSLWGSANGSIPIEDAWANFESFGACDKPENDRTRAPQIDELPRHDWQSDPRLYNGAGYTTRRNS